MDQVLVQLIKKKFNKNIYLYLQKLILFSNNYESHNNNNLGHTSSNNSINIKPGLLLTESFYGEKSNELFVKILQNLEKSQQ